MRHSEPIQKIRKRFRKEWLLIAVDRMNSKTTTPVAGRVLAHSPRREEIHDAMLRRKGLALITYSEDRLPAGYAVAF